MTRNPDLQCRIELKNGYTNGSEYQKLIISSTSRSSDLISNQQTDLRLIITPRRNQSSWIECVKVCLVQIFCSKFDHFESTLHVLGLSQFRELNVIILQLSKTCLSANEFNDFLIISGFFYYHDHGFSKSLTIFFFFEKKDDGVFKDFPEELLLF